MQPSPAAGPLPVAEPQDVGFDPGLLREAVAFAEEAETPWPRDLSKALGSDPKVREPAPWNEVLGPTRPRGGPCGLVMRAGHTAASWGDTRRPDMTFSVAKSYLALLAGVAVDRGLIKDIDDPVRRYALDDGFDSAQNRDVTWRHLLHQTSEWEGTLFEKPDLVDRNRQVGAGADNTRKGTHRDLHRPGTHWEYNDVRVNRLSLALLHVFRQPLPDVFAAAIANPIGCSDSWEWLPYRNGWVDVAGTSMPSVPGGGHWGGGVFIHAEDQARIGELVRSRGRGGNRQLIAAAWFDQLATSCPLRADYGFLWWRNPNRSIYRSAPRDSLFALGAGQHITWVAPSLDLVMVARWIDDTRTDELLGRISAAIT